MDGRRGAVGTASLIWSRVFRMARRGVDAYNSPTLPRLLCRSALRKGAEKEEPITRTCWKCFLWRPNVPGCLAASGLRGRGRRLGRGTGTHRVGPRGGEQETRDAEGEGGASHPACVGKHGVGAAAALMGTLEAFGSADMPATARCLTIATDDEPGPREGADGGAIANGTGVDAFQTGGPALMYRESPWRQPAPGEYDDNAIGVALVCALQDGGRVVGTRARAKDW